MTPQDYISLNPHCTLIPVGKMVIDCHRPQTNRPTVLDCEEEDYAAAFPGFVVINPLRFFSIADCGQALGLLPRVSPLLVWTLGDDGRPSRSRRRGTARLAGRGRRQGICCFITPATAEGHPPGIDREKAIWDRYRLLADYPQLVPAYDFFPSVCRIVT